MAHYLKHGRYEYHLKNIRKALHTQSLRYVQAIINYFPADTKYPGRTEALCCG